MRNILTFLIILLISVCSFPKDKYLIYFKDKGIAPGQTLNKTSALYKEALNSLSKRAIERRRKTMGNDIISYDDLPIKNEYINKLNSLGIKIVRKLTWFNAVSAYLDDSQLTKVREFPFVDKVEPVKVMRFKRDDIEEPGIQKSNGVSKLDYGSSFTQLNLMDVPIVQSKGITGKGILIGFLDSGFRWKDHPALANAHVIAEYDFVFNDSVTANQPGDIPAQDIHGTSVFSEVAGYKDSTLIGASYNSSFILAKTEDERSETHVEEDNYAAALIWMENYGVDITSSSLGYSVFDSDQVSYTYQDMNGQTTIVVKACEDAFSKGVLTITAAGNEGSHPWHYIISPADGFNTIAVGAVYSNNQVTGFSSRGPTSDGRIKPDVLAQGSGVFAASVSGNYTGSFAGTSAATPLAAGVAGLLLSAHPYLTNVQAREILMQTADNYTAPNNERGYGLVSAAKAIDYPNVEINNSNNILHKIFINDYAIDPSTVKINYSINGVDFTEENMTYNDTLRYSFVLPPSANGQSIEFYFTYSDSSGIKYREPSYEDYLFIYGQMIISLTPIMNSSNNYLLNQNYPNPFNKETKIDFITLIQKPAKLVVYNILGQKVKTLFNNIARIGLNSVSWNGKNENGSDVSSGVYYYVLKVGEDSFSKKMVLLK